MAEKIEPKAKTRISAVAKVAQCIPNVLSTNKTYHKARVLRLLPRNHAQNARLHQKIKNRNPENRKEYRSRNIFPGILHFSAQITDVVIAQIAVHRLHRGMAQPGEKNPGETPGAGGVGKHAAGIEMRRASVDQPKNCPQHDYPKHRRDLADSRNATVKQHHGEPQSAIAPRFGCNSPAPRRLVLYSRSSQDVTPGTLAVKYFE